MTEQSLFSGAVSSRFEQASEHAAMWYAYHLPGGKTHCSLDFAALTQPVERPAEPIVLTPEQREQMRAFLAKRDANPRYQALRKEAQERADAEQMTKARRATAPSSSSSSVQDVTKDQYDRFVAHLRCSIKDFHFMKGPECWYKEIGNSGVRQPPSMVIEAMEAAGIDRSYESLLPWGSLVILENGQLQSHGQGSLQLITPPGAPTLLTPIRAEGPSR